MKKSAVISSILILCTIFAAGSGLAFVKYRSIQASMNQGGMEPPMAVQVIEATAAQWVPKSKLVGSVFARRSISLSNEVAGTVKEVLFDSGDVVEQGQILVKMDTSTEEADLLAAEASVRVAQAQIKVAEAEVTAVEASMKFSEAEMRRMKQAVDARAAAETTLERAQADFERFKAQVIQAKSNVESADSQLEQAKARIVQLKTALAKKILLAPFKARVSIRNVHVGQYVGEGTIIADLQGIDDTTYLDFAIPQDQVWRVTPGMKLEARSEVFAGGSSMITVQAIDSSVDRSTRNVRIRAIVDNKDERFKPGTYIDVEVPIGMPEEHIKIPLTAIRRASYGDHVFIISQGENPEELRAKQRFITAGAVQGNEVFVLSGLEKGDKIAADGSFKLRDGALVMIGQDPPAPPAGDQTQRAGK